MKLQSLVASFALSLILTPLAAAQSVNLFQGQEHRTPWPAGLGGAGSFGRGTPAYLSQKVLPDAVVLRGTTPVALAHPDQFFAPLTFPVQAHDLATLDGAGPGGLDAVVFVGPAGVTLGWLDPVTSTVVTELLSSTSAGALLVRAADLDGDGVTDIAVVEADGKLVTPYLADGAGGFDAGAAFSIEASCQNLVLLRWDADESSEYAVLTDLGVAVYDDDGSLVTSWPAVLPGGALCSFSELGSSTDRLLWITAYAPPAQQYMMTLSASGVDDIVNLGALDAFAVVATDYDLDGFEDVLVSHKYSHELLWFENQRTATSPTGPSFSSFYNDMIAFRVGPPASGAPENEAWPVVADFDGDGDDDIVFPIELTQELAVLRGETVDQVGQSQKAQSASYAIDPVSEQGVLTLSFDEPAAAPASATALELEVWRRPDLAGPLEVLSVEHLIVGLPATWPLVVEVPLPETDALFTSSYYIQARLVEQDAQSAVVRAFPTSVAVFSLVDEDLAILELEPTVTDTIEVPVEDNGAAGTTGTKGGIINQRRTGSMPGGSAPKSTVVMF